MPGFVEEQKLTFVPCPHIVACARIFGQKQYNNVSEVTVFPRSDSCHYLLFPKLKRQKLKTSQNTFEQKSCQKLTEQSKFTELVVVSEGYEYQHNATKKSKIEYT